MQRVKMGRRADHTEPTQRELAELSALADGTLEPSRRASVEAHIAASPELSALYERERRVVAALHSSRASDRAPARLRARIDAARPSRARAARRRLGYAGALAGALAAIALALVLALPGGTPGAPSVSDAAALAARGPAQPAPVPDPSNPGTRLRQKLGAVYFPNWTASFGWRAVGARTDRLGAQEAVTVYYESNNVRIAYTIVAAPPLAQPAAHRIWRDGTELRTLTHNGRLVVTWRRAGDTCVLSGNGITAAELQKLAAWKVPTDRH
jgi:anti-sigma factor RsiW